jgi:CBS domain-containing protein
MEEETTVKQVMTDGVIAIEKDASIMEAAKLLREQGIRGLVVIDEGDAVGIIVCRDIVYSVVSKKRDPKGTRVEDIMSEDLIVAEESERLDDIAMAMIENDVSRIPVVRGEMLVGILTQSDVLRAWPGFAEVMQKEEVEE